MANTKKLLITRRRNEFFFFRQRFKLEQFCEKCGVESCFVSLEDAMLFSDLTMREIVRRTDSEEIHFLESGGGLLVVCLNSIKNFSKLTRRIK